MKYLKIFENHAAYAAAQSSLILPNVSLITENNKVEYKPSQVEPQYRWTNSGTTCSGCYKYNNQVYEVSNDNGNTWQIVTPVQTRMGTLIEGKSVDCGWAAPISITSISEELPIMPQPLTITLSRPLSESEMCCDEPTMERLSVDICYYASNLDEEEGDLTFTTCYFEFDEDQNLWEANLKWTYSYYEYNSETQEYELSWDEERESYVFTDSWEGEISELCLNGNCVIKDISMNV